jgi:uncharacterized YkwD family protein/spore coat assembly protein SafA
LFYESSIDLSEIYAETKGGGDRMNCAKRLRKFLICILTSLLLVLPFNVLAQSGTHTVAAGDTMWKIAVRYQIGLSELLKANPQISNPALIYAGQKINIPSIDDVKALEQQVINLVNQQRANYGLPLLKANWELCRVARYKSQDMIDKRYFDHQSPTYGSPFNMMESFGIRFTAAGENIAYGQRTPQAVMNDWMNSTGHRNNILSRVYNQIGVGVAKASNGTFYWTQEFIKNP